MDGTLKILIDENARIERILSLKISVLNLPVNILTSKEIKEVKKLFEDFTTRLDKAFNVFNESYESKISQNKKIDDSEKNIMNQFDIIRKKDKELQEQLEFLCTSFDKLRQEELKYLAKNKRINQKQDDEISVRSGSVGSDVGEHEKVIINKIFLNSIVTTNNILILQSKQTLQEERDYMMELFKLAELFPTSVSKQLILVDFFMNIYNFCLSEEYTIEQMSTAFSIFYFLFSYSFINKNVIVEISQSLFVEILNFHSLNRPPFSYEIFNSKEREKLENFGKNGFYRNYSLFENIFQYGDVSICFFSKDPMPIPESDFNKNDQYIMTNDNMRPIEELPDVMKTLIDENGEGLVTEKVESNRDQAAVQEAKKSEQELDYEKRLANLEEFISSFTNSANVFDEKRKREEMAKEAEQGKIEGKQAADFLKNKINELSKQIDERVNICTKNVVNPVDEEIAERSKNVKKK